ncbi:MAG TPA: response regulator transcription factor [Candidatus Acidoferrales bacterium]|nr:response regulator transcription factor [Candidatus Acidoferrales bacterium]
MTKIRLLLLDDHALFRAGLSRLLGTESDFQLVAQCATSAEALDVLAQQPVDLVLLDYDLGEEHGFEFIRKARETGHTGRVFIVTAGMSDADSVRALGHGVCGIFLKTSPPAQLSEAIRKVMAGETWIDQRCIRALVQAVDRSKENERNRQLTDRERDVLKGVFEGLTNKEIAAALGISEGSVKSALQQLFLKTGVRTRSQLVRVALEEYAGAWGLGR